MSELVISVTSADGRVASVFEADDIASVRVELQGHVLFERSLAVTDTLDYGYEGCHAALVRWFGEELVVISAERGRLHVWSGDTPKPQLVFSSHYVVTGDLLLLVDPDSPGLIRCVQLPSLEPLTPLPMRGSEKNVWLLATGERTIGLERGQFADTLQLPLPQQRLQVGSAPSRRIEAALHELLPAHELTPMIIAAAGSSFWIPPATPFQPSSAFLPVYWYRHLANPADLLALFDAISAPLPKGEPEVGWPPHHDASHGAVMLAARHVQRRAAMYAQICRSGQLPQGWWDLMFEPLHHTSEYGNRVDLSRWPSVLGPYFAALAATRPPQVKLVH